MVILLVLFRMTTSLANTGKVEVQIITGAFWKELPTTINYEGTIPLVYKMERYRSQWDSQHPIFTLDCQETFNKETPECRLLNGIENLAKTYKKQTSEMEELRETHHEGSEENYENNGKVHKRALDFVGEFGAWCCGLATQHKLDKLVMNENELGSEMRKLKKGLSETLKNIGSQLGKFARYANTTASALRRTEHQIHLIENFVNSMTANVSNKLNAEGKALVVVLYQEYLNLKRVVELSYLMEENEIISSCKHHLIPQGILKPIVLKGDLEKLSQHLESSGFGLAIHERDVSRYFQLPLCDCTVVKNEIIVYIRIPVAHLGSRWKLFELITTAFAWGNRTCKIQHETLYIAVSGNSTHNNLRSVSGSGLHQCKPYHDKLCHLPRFSADATHGPICAMRLFSGSTVEELSHHCPMSCFESKALSVTEVDENTFVIAHIPQHAKIFCEAKIVDFDKDSHQPGAKKIRMPCHCELRIKNEVIIPRNFPCGRDFSHELEIVHVLPVIWTRVDSSLHHRGRDKPILTYDSIEQPLNTNWTLEVPYINLTSEKSSIENIKSILDQSHLDSLSFSDKYGLHVSSLFWLWNMALSAAVGYIIFRGRIQAREGPESGRHTRDGDSEPRRVRGRQVLVPPPREFTADF